MSILTFPDILPSSQSFGLRSNTQVFRSPLSGATQVLELPGAVWQATLGFELLVESNRQTLISFLTQLRGQAGRFYLYDHAHPTPFGVATGAPVVSGGGQSGSTLVTSGWTPSTTGILKVGDYFEVGGELKMVTADADSDVSGNATLQFEPPLRITPTDLANITVDKPTAIMRLDEPVFHASTKPPVIASVSFKCTEALV